MGRLSVPVHTAGLYQVRDWAMRLRVELGALEVADLGHKWGKWGAATPGGRVRIHWAAMQLRPPLVDSRREGLRMKLPTMQQTSGVISKLLGQGNHRSRLLLVS